MEKLIHPKKNHLFLFYKNLVQAAHIPVFLVFLFTVFKKEVHMKATTAFKSTFISLLFCIPAIPVFAQSVPIVGETYAPSPKQLSPADINLPNNLFRWEPTYLQTLANQKAMTSQHVPYLSLNEIKEKKDVFPKTRLSYHLNTSPMTFTDTLLGLISVATELWCSHYYGRTGSDISTAIPTTQSNTF